MDNNHNKNHRQLDLKRIKSIKRKRRFLTFRKSVFGRLRLELVKHFSRRTVYILYISSQGNEQYLFRHIKRLIHRGHRVHLVKV